VKVARWVWSRGKDGDYIKILPTAIKQTGAIPQDGIPERDRCGGLFLFEVTRRRVEEG